MPYVIPTADFERIAGKVEIFFEGFREDLELAGKAGTEAVIRTTLAGLGEDDQPFQGYSASYQRQLDSVGGKAQGVVTLRGVFEHSDATRGQRQSNRDRRNVKRGAGQRGTVTITTGGRTFQARTAITRPQRGVTDPQSEMSLDLLKVEATDTKLTIRYEPRKQPYMIYHQRGEGKNPRRPWLSAKKEAVWGGMMSIVKAAIKARARWFNSHQGGQPPAGAGASSGAT